MSHVSMILWCAHTVLESLPISSSGHMRLLVRALTKLTQKRVELTESLEHRMHLTTLILVAVFIATHTKILLDAVPNTYGSSLQKWAFGLLFIGIADSITVLGYLVLKRFKPTIPLAFGFMCTGLLLLSLNYITQGAYAPLGYKHAWVLGLAQSVALLPGVSRLASTYVAGCWLGLDPQVSFVLSWALQLPLIAAALVQQVLAKRFGSIALSVWGWLLISTVTALSYGLVRYEYTLSSVYIAYIGWYMLVPTLLACWLTL